MTATQIQKKLETMKGRSFEYAKQIHIVKSYTINKDDENFTMKTNLNEFDRKFESAKSFFDYWFEQPENAVIDTATRQLPALANAQMDVAIVQTNGLADDLVKILKDNIEKVSKNPAYVDQAKAVDKSVDTILKVKKMQLEMYKAVQPKNNK